MTCSLIIFMPINATIEYFKAEEKFHSAKTREEKIVALEEMIRELPKHKGVENLLAQLRAKLSKLKKDVPKKVGRIAAAVKKEGEAQVCLIGLTNSGKSTIISKLTDAKPLVADYEYTTKKPVVGMMDYKGVKVQLVEIPSTFQAHYMSIAKTADAIALVVRNSEDDEKRLRQICKDSFIHLEDKPVVILDSSMNEYELKERIWSHLGLIVVYTRDPGKKRRDEPMALPKGAKVKEFAHHIHKDFVKNFSFARLWRRDARGVHERQVGPELHSRRRRHCRIARKSMMFIFI